MSEMTLPKQARDGLMRAWIGILNERHPGITWTAKETETPEPEEPTPSPQPEEPEPDA